MSQTNPLPNTPKQKRSDQLQAVARFLISFTHPDAGLVESFRFIIPPDWPEGQLHPSAIRRGLKSSILDGVRVQIDFEGTDATLNVHVQPDVDDKPAAVGHEVVKTARERRLPDRDESDE